MLRTGTTFLFDLLANDTSTFRTPLTWESHFVYPPPDESNYDCDPRIEKTKKVYDLMCYFLPELMVCRPPAVFPGHHCPCSVLPKPFVKPAKYCPFIAVLLLVRVRCVFFDVVHVSNLVQAFLIIADYCCLSLPLSCLSVQSKHPVGAKNPQECLVLMR